MALITCPECSKQVSEQAPSCPHCGCPIATSGRSQPQQIVIQQPSSSSGPNFAACGCLIPVVILAIFLAFTNPTEADMRAQLAKDGWAPVAFERKDLILFNWVSVTGFTRAKGKYLGIAGKIFKLSEEKAP
jgi:hypothetical protein